MSRFGVIAALLLVVLALVGAGALWSGARPGRSIPAPEATPGNAAAAEIDPIARLDRAIRDHDAAAVASALAGGVDPDSVDSEGETFLNKAVLYGTPEIVEVLLTAGANPDVPGKNGLGPLAIAALAGRHDMLERLLPASAAHAASSAADGQGAAPHFEPPAAVVAKAPPPTPAAVKPEPAATAEPPAAEAAEGARSVQPPPTAPVLALRSVEGTGSAPIAGGARVLAIDPVMIVPRPPSSNTEQAATAGGSVAAREPPSPPPQKDSTGPQVFAPTAWVVAAQRRLGQLGYYAGPVTGVAGPLTAAAVKRYQAVAGIPQDGVVSEALLARIGANIEAPQAATEAAALAPTGEAAQSPTNAGDAGTAADGEGESLRNALKAQAVLGEDFDSATRPEAMRRYCLQNANAWIYDTATGRSVFCRDVIGAPPR
jgi:hypothetical protein